MASPASIDPGLEHPFLRGLLDGMRCGILCVDRKGRIVMLNDLGAQILNLPHAPAAGTPVDEALPQFPGIVRVLGESFGMSHLPNRAELNLAEDGGAGKTIGFTLSFVGGAEPGAPDRESQGVAMFFKDLTHIEQHEEQERLRDRLATLGQMAASLAHEIRNPLASIEVTCGLMKRRLGEDAAALDLLQKVTVEVQRLNETITSSLEFVRPIAMDFAPAHLSHVLDAAINVALKRGGGPGVKVASTGADHLSPFLMDRQQLRQVFENLLINALEAMGSSGNLSISVETLEASDAMVPYRPKSASKENPWDRARQFAVIRVRDDGPGIPPARLDKIFVPFFTTKKKGSGVGLSMVKKIVDSHHGLIDVDEAVGGGTVFTVRLPMIQVAPRD